MNTWIFLLPAILLYACRVNADFGMKVDSNETEAALPSSNDSGNDPQKMMIIVPDDEIELQKAAISDDVTPENYEDASMSTTDHPNHDDDEIMNDNMEFENVIIENGKINDNSHNEAIPLPPPSGLDQIGNHFSRLQDELVTPTYFEFNKLQQTNAKEEPRLSKLQENYPTISNLKENHVQTWNEVQPKFDPISSPLQFYEFLGGTSQRHDLVQNDQIRQYQIEAAKAHIKQIELEQEYALKSKGFQPYTFKTSAPLYTEPSPTRWGAVGYSPSYTPPSFLPLPPVTPLSHLSSLNGQSTHSIPGSPYNLIDNNYKPSPVTSYWNGQPNHLDGSINKYNDYITYQLSSLKHNLEVTQNPLLTPITKLDKNQWTSSPHQWRNPIAVQNSHGASTYSGPTASPVVLSSGYLDETEDVKQARQIHLRAISETAQPFSHWRDEQTTNSWR